ncbi:hypothetical protein ACKWTF_010760 [Chironomus riparius]
MCIKNLSSIGAVEVVEKLIARFEIFCKQTNKQTNKQTRKQVKKNVVKIEYFSYASSFNNARKETLKLIDMHFSLLLPSFLLIFKEALYFFSLMNVLFLSQLFKITET